MRELALTKAEAQKNAQRARAIAQAMRALGDHLTSLNSAVESWEREAARLEAMSCWDPINPSRCAAAGA